MKLQGARLVGGLLAWLGAGFLADAALAPVTYEARQAAGLQAGSAPSLVLRAGLSAVGLALVLAGTWLLIRDPGEGAVPEDAAGAPDGRGPTRCWRCRAAWPADAEACPECGAERLQ